MRRTEVKTRTREMPKGRTALEAALQEAKERFRRKPGIIPGVPGAEDPRFQGMLRQAVENHVESFNTFLEQGLMQIVKNLAPVEVDPEDKGDPGMIISLTDLRVLHPVMAGDGRKIFPRDCRLGHLTYNAKLTGTLQFLIGRDATTIEASFGDIPIMVRSLKCNTYGLRHQELVARGEDETEAGGYFVIHGLERVIRMLVMPRHNYPMAVIRGAYRKRGALYTKYAVLMRCMRSDGTTQTNTLHYTSDGACYLRFSHSKEEWLVPLLVVLHALYPMSDQALGQLLAGQPSKVKVKHAGSNEGHNDDVWTCVLVMLQQQRAKQPIPGQREALRYLGKTMRASLGNEVSERLSDQQVGEFLVKKFIMVHTEQNQEKLFCLVVMFQKLMGLVTGTIDADSQDTLNNHDVLLPGTLYGAVLKEQIEKALLVIKAVISKLTRKDETGTRKHSIESFRSNPELLQKQVSGASSVGRSMESFVSTGNISSRGGLDLMQVSGYTVVADKLNQARFSSHFGAVHRGQYFAEMKTTTVRKLLPETWGFVCPVHTPDGAPCGLLNHLATSCRAVVKLNEKSNTEAVRAVLVSLGLHTLETSKFEPFPLCDRGTYAWVLLDGVIQGFVEHTRLEHFEHHLRECKVLGKHGMPPELEIACITSRTERMFPGLFLFLGPGRLVRPVSHLATKKVEMIGPLEQLFMKISVLPEERLRAQVILEEQGQQTGEEVEQLGAADDLPEQLPVSFSHEELDPTRMLSLLAGLTPFSNHNQSPRNMYQCQMLKQTMGTPYHNHVFRTDNKVFRILNPQKPLVRTKTYERANCDLHPTGTNAIVAVITYTGYDMEDAMLISKASYERGFAHGAVYKTKVIEAAPSRATNEAKRRSRFGNLVSGGPGRPVQRVSEALDCDGLPPIGTCLTRGDPMYCVIDHAGNPKVEKYHDDEPAYVEQATLIDGQSLDIKTPVQRLMLKLRYTRNPVVGDKFSSRHGQKGVMSLLWPQEDMPFTERGITPDILFNPHGFPSRMTIGMLIESIAGKASTSEGRSVADGSTFRGYKGRFHQDGNNEHDPFLQSEDLSSGPPKKTQVGGLEVANYFGDTLTKHGFKKLGTERMFSGIHGTEFETDIFIGVIYYQRLRHLVLDKAQARSRGPCDRITHQPVKGRKRGGGIRFGEMERDALIAHGAAHLLHDRLFRCSDFDTAYVCPKCSSIITPQANAHTQTKELKRESHAVVGEPWECPPCSREAKQPVLCHPTPVPWVFRYLVCELAAMNVKVNVRVCERGRQTSLSFLSPDLLVEPEADESPTG